MSHFRNQRTIARSAVVQGFGYWCGQDVRVEFRPAQVGTGLVFVRDDLGPTARLQVDPRRRIDVPRRTNLSSGPVRVDMVEHVLAALAGLQIDNCEIGVNQTEMPGCDGSALKFVEALEAAGIVYQRAPAELLEVTETVRLVAGEGWIEARPSQQKCFSVEFHLDYPHDDAIGQQSFSIDVTPETFRSEIAPSRTFLLQKEADEMLRLGLGRRVTSSDLLIFGEQGPIDNRLRFADECVRHKVLDVIGDMALMGRQLIGRIVAHRSGHRLNAALATELVARFGTVAPERERILA